jgi:hypothetical protein
VVRGWLGVGGWFGWGYEGSEESFCVFPGSRQLFDEDDSSACGAVCSQLGWEDDVFGGDVGDVNPVRSPATGLKETKRGTRRLIYVVRDVGKSSSLGVNLEISCHGELST